MHLEKLYALNFKNYEEFDLLFSPRINVFLGKNGSGKTNLLDSIYYLSLTKSAFTSIDSHIILHDESYFMVKGVFDIKGMKSEVSSSLQSGMRKVFREGTNEYEKLSEHIGKYPVVLVAPDDADVVKEGSELRRKFFDGILSQIDKKYLEDLIAYNHAVKQRSGLLKMFYEQNKRDLVALQVYDELLIRHGSYIFERRRKFIEEFQPIFQLFFSAIVQEGETTDVRYNSMLAEQSFAEGLARSRQKDLILQRCNFGVHRDDFDFRLGNGDLKRLGGVVW